MGGPDEFKKIALSDYDIFDEEYRPVLNERIVQHYYFREIGYETIEQFCWGVRNEMRESAPIYNGIYRAVKDFSLHPGWTTYLKSVGDTTGASSSQSDSTSDTTGTNKTESTSYASNYEMPNTRLTAGEDYMSNAAKNEGVSAGETGAKTTSADKNTGQNSGHSESETGGWQGITGDILMSLASTLTSGDKEVFRILDKHFMSIWNGGQGYGPGGWGFGWAFPYAGIF